jgi:hypothetical protein
MTRDKIAEAQERLARKVKATICLGCGGCGHREVPTATPDGETGVLVRKCQTCDGTGKRPGFEPPV